MKPLNPRCLVLAGLLLSSASGLVADETVPFLGQWAAPCSFFGNEAQCTVEWGGGLNSSIVEMYYSVSVAGDPGRILFQGKSVLKQTDDGFQGFWSDSNGALHPVAALLKGAEMKSEWGEAETEQGRSHYRLLDTGQLQVTDWVLGEGEWRKFMDVTYERVVP